MISEELFLINQVAEQSDMIIDSMLRIQDTLDNLGTCTSVNFSSPGKPDFIMNAESLGLAEETFETWFTDVQRQMLELLKSQIKEDFKNLEFL